MDVRFRDLDPLGHVNNAVFLSYMELARIRYFQRISPDWLEEGHFVVARMEVDYLRPILLGDEVFVGARTAAIRRPSLRMAPRATANPASWRPFIPPGKPTSVNRSATSPCFSRTRSACSPSPASTRL